MSREKAPPTKVRPGADTTAERIVDAACRLFGTKGYEGTSTKEICDLAEVNIAAIHYHFGSKEELLRTILEEYGRSSLLSALRVLEEPASKDVFRVRLTMYVQEVIDSFLQHPELCKIIQQEVELLHARSEAVFRETFMKRYEALVHFISVAKERGIVRESIDPELAARALFSQLSWHMRFDHVLKRFHDVTLRDVEFREKWISQTVNMFIEGVGGN